MADKKIRMVPVEFLLELRENKVDHVIVDVLTAETHAEGHLPDAVNIPVVELRERAPKELPMDTTIVVYCADYMCQASTGAAETLLELGYEHVYDFKGGKKLWSDLGLPLVK